MATGALAAGLQKVHGLQGPVDDAFMDAFSVRASDRHARGIRPREEWARRRSTSSAPNFAKWLRGDVRVKDDRAVAASDIADYNLILFGDPGSNSVIAKVIGEAADPLDEDRDRRRNAEVRRRRSHSGADLSESAQSEALRGDQQRAHVRRRRFPRHQRVALPAAGRLLGADAERRHRAVRILRRALATLQDRSVS